MKIKVTYRLEIADKRCIKRSNDMLRQENQKMGRMATSKIKLSSGRRYS